MDTFGPFDAPTRHIQDWWGCGGMTWYNDDRRCQRAIWDMKKTRIGPLFFPFGCLFFCDAFDRTWYHVPLTQQWLVLPWSPGDLQPGQAPIFISPIQPIKNMHFCLSSAIFRILNLLICYKDIFIDTISLMSHYSIDGSHGDSPIYTLAIPLALPSWHQRKQTPFFFSR